MSIRTFLGETWICGWFNPEDGSLMDIQQYSTEEGARRTAEQFKNSYQTFVGKIEDVTESFVPMPNPEFVDPEFFKGCEVKGNQEYNQPINDESIKYERYLTMLFESQRVGHEVHVEIDEALKLYKSKLGL